LQNGTKYYAKFLAKRYPFLFWILTSRCKKKSQKAKKNPHAPHENFGILDGTKHTHENFGILHFIIPKQLAFCIP
jgi:hypothetical protein